MDTWEPAWPGRPSGPASLGRRIAGLRGERGWTQQRLADRLGISRVAVSHLETDVNTPSERTVALLAGIFHLEPHALVAGTTYPMAKADRLPLVVARWTEVDHQLALLAADVGWLDDPMADAATRERVLGRWEAELAKLAAEVLDPDEGELVAAARRHVADLRRTRNG